MEGVIEVEGITEIQILASKQKKFFANLLPWSRGRIQIRIGSMYRITHK